MTTKGQTIAYLRVSTETQNLDRQEDLAQEADQVFFEKASAKNRDRPKLQEMLTYAREGDHIKVWSIDRLARSIIDLQELVEEINSKGATITFVKEHMTFSPGTQDIYQSLMFNILGAFAEFERKLIRERQREGIEKAKKLGKYKGRKRKLTDEEVAIAYKRHYEMATPQRRIAKELGISPATLNRELKAYEASLKEEGVEQLHEGVEQ